MTVTNEFLSEEELVEYNSIHSSFKRAEQELAYATSQLSNIQSRQKSSLANYDNALANLDHKQADLVKKYGAEIQIKLDTGEIIRQDGVNS